MENLKLTIFMNYYRNVYQKDPKFEESDEFKG